MIRAISSLLPFMVCVLGQNVPRSPCPDVFTYEANGTEPGQWYGLINISSESTLYSVFLNILLDGKAELLGNWLGPVRTLDNMEFNIENIKLKILPGTKTPVRFFIKHKLETKPPKLQVIRLNGREICNANISLPEVVSVTTMGSIQELPERPTPPPPIVIQSPKPIQNIPVFKTPAQPTNPSKIETSSSTEISVALLEQLFGSGNNQQEEKPINTQNSLSIPALPVSSEPDENENPGTYEEFTFGPKPIRLPDINKEQNVCGTVSLNNANPLVLKGKPTLEGQWPWHASLYRAQDIDIKYICGGTLVSPTHVVTAAHCVTLQNSNRRVNTNVLTVHLGKYNLRTTKGVQSVFVSDIIVHPEYNGQTFSRDLSVLILEEPARFTDWVRPACLWPDNLVNLNTVARREGVVVENLKFQVVGWELNAAGVAMDELRLVGMLVVDQETCLRSHDNFYRRYTSEFTYCAGYRNGSTACNGDSGGGMVLKLENRWYLRGLVSLSVATPSGACDPKHYIVFTDIAKFLPWLKDIISKSQPAMF